MPRKGKRPSLDALRRQKPGHAPSAAGADAGAEGGARPKRADEDVRAMTLRLPRDLMRSLKLATINEERPASEFVRDALRAYLRNAGPGRVERGEP